MGTRNPDRIPLREFRLKYETVADMIAGNWLVISWCTTCELSLVVDLQLIRRVSGPKASMWNRAGRCRKLGCHGVTILKAKPPFHGFFSALQAEWPEGAPPRKAYD